MEETAQFLCSFTHMKKNKKETSKCVDTAEELWAKRKPKQDVVRKMTVIYFQAPRNPLWYSKEDKRYPPAFSIIFANEWLLYGITPFTS